MTLREALQDIYDRHDKLTAALVVEEARLQNTDAGKILHGSLEWDDAAAGEAWRLEQARGLIRRYKVSYTKEDGTKGKVRAFCSVNTENGHVFEPIVDIREDPINRKILLASMEREWKALLRRYEQFEEFFELVEEDMKQKV